MKPKLRLVRQTSSRALVLVAGCSLLSSVSAAVLKWDANGTAANVTNGAGSWNTTGSNWNDGTTTGLWTNGNTALIGTNPTAGAGGVITFTDTVDIFVAGLQVGDNGNATNHTLAPPATGSALFGIDAGGISAADGLAISQPVFLTADQSWTRAAGGAGTLDVNGVVSGSDRNLSLSSALGATTQGLLVRGVNTYSGNTTINDGYFQVGLSAFGSSNVFLNGTAGAAQRIQFVTGGTVAGANGDIGNLFILNPGKEGNFYIWGSTTTTLTNGIAGGDAAAIIRKQDSGTLVLAGGNTYAGTFIQENGTTVSTGTNANANYTVTGGTLAVAGTNADASYTVNAGALWLGNNGGSGAMSPNGTLTLNGGSLNLRRTDTVNASEVLPSTITLGAATVEMNPTSETGFVNFDRDLGGDPTKGTLRVSGGTLSLPFGTDVLVNTFSLGLQSATNRGVLEINEGATLGAQFFDLGTAGGGSGVINQRGGTATVLAGGNGFRLGHWTTNANPANTYNLSGGVLDATALAANADTARIVNIGWDGLAEMTVGGGSGTATLKAYGIQIDANGDTTGFNDKLTLSENGIVEVGAGGIATASVNDKFILNSGTLKVTDNVTATGGGIVTADGSATTIDANQFTLTLSAAMAGTGILNVATTTGVVNFDTGAANVTPTVTLTGLAANVAKTGAGVMTLSGTHPLNGNFRVSQGVLNLTGSIASNVTAADGTTLTGEGSVGGDLILGSGTGSLLVVDPASPGALAVTGNLHFVGTNSVRIGGMLSPGVNAIPVMTHGGTITTGALGTNLVLENMANFRTPSLTDNAGTITATFDVRQLIWGGTGTTLTWEVGGILGNWGGGDTSFYSMDHVTFDNTGTAGTVILSGQLSPGLVTVNSTNDYSFTGTGSIIGAANLTKTGSGKLTIATANSYTGVTSVGEGTLVLGNAAALGTGDGGTTVYDGATLDVNGQNLGLGTEAIHISGSGVGGTAGALTNTSTTAGTVRSVTLDANAMVKVDSGKTLIIGQNIGNGAAQGTLALGTNTLTKEGTGELMLNGVNVQSGNIVINQGSIRLMRGYTTTAGEVNFGQQPTTLGGTGTLTINAGGTLTTNRWSAGLNISMPMVLNGGTFTSNWPGPNGATISSPVEVTATSTISFGGGYGVATFSGPITGAGGLNFASDGVTLTGANTFSGGAMINSGTLGFNSGSLGTGTVTMNGGTLRWNGTHSQDVSAQLAMVTGKNAPFDTGANNVVFATPIGNATTASMTKLGTGSLTLAGSNTYTGATNVQAGSLILPAGTNVLSPLTVVTLGNAANSGKLVLQGTTQTVAGLNVAGTGTTNSIVGGSATTAVLTVNAATNSASSATIGGTGTNENNISITKTGAGTLSLTGANTYTGATTVSEGTLMVTSTPASAMSVANGATLAVNGTVGPVNISPGGTISPAGPPSAVNALARTVTTGTTSTVTTTGDFQELHNTTGTVVPANTTYTYTGQIYLPGVSGTKYYFGENFDDSIVLKIGGTTVLAANAWNAIGTGSFTSTGPGWYSISLEAYNGTGGTGPVTATGWGPGKGVGFTATAPTTATDGSFYSAFTLDNLTAAGIQIRSASGVAECVAGSTIGGIYRCDVSELNSDKLVVTGDLNLSGATLTVNPVGGGATQNTYVIATYTGTLTGTFASVQAPAGYAVNYNTAAKQVELIQSAAGYSSWIAGYPGLSDITPGGDPDHDGITNLMEYVLGGDPSAPGTAVLPVQTMDATNVTFTFKRRDDSESDTTQKVQWSTNLTGWTDIAIGAGNSSGVTIAENGASPDDVTVVIPRSNASPDGKLFIRLRVTQP